MKIFVSAGEVSGDLHGSYLVREIKKLKPEIYFFGLGSSLMAGAGVDIHFDIIRRGTIGIFETLPNVLPIYLTFQKVKKTILAEKPDLVLLIDSQGFNMPLAKFCKKIGVKTIYYFAPQDWLWGTKRGLKNVAKTVDHIIAVFEKEYSLYKEAGASVYYFGHPLVDIVKAKADKATLRRRYRGPEFDLADPVIALCPGSRLQEIRALLPILLRAGKIISREIPGANFILPVASARIIKDIFDLVDGARLKTIVGETYDILYAADLAICASGTINLEASLLGVPNIMTYKLSPLTYMVGKHLLKIDKKIAYFSMPNILLKEKVIPELVMADANPDRIAREAVSILTDNQRVSYMKGKFNVLRGLLGGPGVIEKAAEQIVKLIYRSDAPR